MSTNAHSQGFEAGAAGQAGTVLVPRLRVGHYSAWRPQMENTLMRAGIATRDYAVGCADWAALASAVDNWAHTEEQASIAYALTGVNSAAVAAAAASSKGASGPSASELASEAKARRGAMEAVARMRKAFALLYQALADELRVLVAGVPQGYAYGLWSWLESRYQSTEQDSIGDLWEEFTQLEQEEEESFDAYKARVDRTNLLLDNAKDKPSAGLYAHRLLRKLRPNYNAAVLALNASGRLKDAIKMPWGDIVTFINNHEKNERRLTEQGGDEDHSRAMSAARSGGRRGVSFESAQQMQRRGAGMECFRCGGKGHWARDCKARYQDTRNRSEGESDDENAQAGSGTRQQRANSCRRPNSQFAGYSSDEVDDDKTEFLFSAVRVSSGGDREKTEDQARPVTAAQDRPGAVSVRKSRPGRAAGSAAGSGGLGPGGVQLALVVTKSEVQGEPATAMQERPGAVSIDTNVSLAGRNKQQYVSLAGRNKQQQLVPRPKQMAKRSGGPPGSGVGAVPRGEKEDDYLG